MKVVFSIFIFSLFACFSISAQVKDSVATLPIDSNTKVIVGRNVYGTLLDNNIFLSVNGKSEALAINTKKHTTSDSLFYIVAALFLLLGLLRTIFSRYFTNMFRVFFNTSLRQNQLTDQLEQAALPSLLFNIFFMLSMGLYIYFLYDHYNPQNQKNNWFYVGLFILLVGICYIVKYVSMLFIGWLTNHKPEAKIYIFSIFLLNKIIGMFLLPFTMLIAFSSNKIAEYASLISISLLAILLISRFLRSYGLLQNSLRLNAIYFLVFLISFEILPILLVYKTVVVFFGINS